MTRMHWTASCRRWRLSRGKKKGSQQVGLFFWLPFSEQFVRGYVKILGKDGNFIVRDETAALFDAQDGQVVIRQIIWSRFRQFIWMCSQVQIAYWSG